MFAAVASDDAPIVNPPPVDDPPTNDDPPPPITRVMTSTDGAAWMPVSTGAANQWKSLCWAPELGSFVAVATSGNARVMVSGTALVVGARGTGPTGEAVVTTDGYIGLAGQTAPDAYLHIGTTIPRDIPDESGVGIKVMLTCDPGKTSDGIQCDVVLKSGAGNGTSNAILGRNECFDPTNSGSPPNASPVLDSSTSPNSGAMIAGRFDATFHQASAGTDRDAWGGHIQCRIGDADKISASDTPPHDNSGQAGQWYGNYRGCEVSLDNFSAYPIDGTILHLGSHGVSEIKSGMYISCGGYPSRDTKNTVNASNVIRNFICMTDDTQTSPTLGRTGRGPADNFIYAGPVGNDGAPNPRTDTPAKFVVDKLGALSATSLDTLVGVQTYTPTASSTVGTDWIPTYDPNDPRTGIWYRIGKLVYVYVNFVFTTPSSTSNAGFLRVSLPVAGSPNVPGGLVVNAFWGTTALTWPNMGTMLTAQVVSGQVARIVSAASKVAADPSAFKVSLLGNSNKLTISLSGVYLAA